MFTCSKQVPMRSVFSEEEICRGLVHISIIYDLVQECENPVVVKSHLSDLEKKKMEFKLLFLF